MSIQNTHLPKPKLKTLKDSSRLSKPHSTKWAAGSFVYQAVTLSCFIWIITDFKNNILTPSKIEKELKKIWPDLEIYPHKRETTVLTDTDTSEKKKILSLRTSPLKVAFIENTNAKSSSWTKEHIVAIEKIRKELGHEIDVTIYDEVNSEEEQIQALEEAIKRAMN